MKCILIQWPWPFFRSICPWITFWNCVVVSTGWRLASFLCLVFCRNGENINESQQRCWSVGFPFQKCLYRPAHWSLQVAGSVRDHSPSGFVRKTCWTTFPAWKCPKLQADWNDWPSDEQTKWLVAVRNQDPHLVNFSPILQTADPRSPQMVTRGSLPPTALRRPQPVSTLALRWHQMP